jgi:tetraacyldisaccharide 4'-kinase
VIRRCGERILARPPIPLLPLLIPLSLAYRALAAVHRWFFSSGLLRSAVLPRPVISIGNLSVGGGGKTPLVMWLAGRLEKEGARITILSRGYGRLERGTTIAEPGTDWKRLGDEPALMVKRLKNITIAVSPDRYRGGMEVLSNQDVDLFLLDDGFGHHALYKDLEIVVIDDLRRFGNGRVLPAGILREPPGRLRDAQLIIVTKALSIDPVFEKKAKKYADVPVLWSDYRPRGFQRIDEAEGDESISVPDGPLLGFCGIANPESFRRSLDIAGIQTVEFLSFPDHHPYTASDVSAINEKALKHGAAGIVTTEKDAVRWPLVEESLPCYALTMDVTFLDGESTLMDTVSSIIERSGNSS